MSLWIMDSAVASNGPTDWFPLSRTISVFHSCNIYIDIFHIFYIVHIIYNAYTKTVCALHSFSSAIPLVHAEFGKKSFIYDATHTICTHNNTSYPQVACFHWQIFKWCTYLCHNTLVKTSPNVKLYKSEPVMSIYRSWSSLVAVWRHCSVSWQSLASTLLQSCVCGAADTVWHSVSNKPTAHIIVATVRNWNL